MASPGDGIRQCFSDAIPHLCGMAGLFRGLRPVGTLRAFMDESSVGSTESPAFIFGGVIGSVDDIGEAADAWQVCLDDSPSIPYFHYKFKSHRTRLPLLAKTLADSKLQAIIVTVPHAPFRNRNKTAAKGTFGTQVYDWAFITAVREILNWVDENFPPDEIIHFIFDKRGELNRCRAEFFDRFSNEPEKIWRHAGTRGPGDAEKIAALQTGDLLAGEVLNYIRTERDSPGLVEVAEATPVLLFKGIPPPAIQESLALQNFGKGLFDAGRRKILAYPSNSLPVSLFSRELAGILAIKTWLEANLEGGPPYEATTERCRIHAIHKPLAIYPASFESGAKRETKSGEAMSVRKTEVTG